MEKKEFDCGREECTDIGWNGSHSCLNCFVTENDEDYQHQQQHATRNILIILDTVVEGMTQHKKEIEEIKKTLKERCW